MPDRLRLGPLPVLDGERVILRERGESDIDDRLRYPIDLGEEDGYGSSWRRDWDGRRYHICEHLAAGHGPAEPGSYRWEVGHEGHCIGSAGLRVDADQRGAACTAGVFVPGLGGQGLGRCRTASQRRFPPRSPYPAASRPLPQAARRASRTLLPRHHLGRTRPRRPLPPPPRENPAGRISMNVEAGILMPWPRSGRVSAAAPRRNTPGRSRFRN